MRSQSRDIRVQQNSINLIRGQGTQHVPFMAQIVQRYSDRMTCDVKTVDGFTIKNVPVVTSAGLVDGEPYGTMDLPNIDDWVLIGSGGAYNRQSIIVGVVVPYLTNDFTADAVNSSNKQFSKKLLEADKEGTYRRIFQSGTTIEVQDDGSVILETPSGTYVQIDESNDKIVVEDQHGNTITLDANGVIVEDGLGTPNKITFSSTGVSIDDTNGNNVTMAATTGVTINNHLVVAP